MFDVRCAYCDRPYEENEQPVIEYDATLGVHFLVHDYCAQQREVDEARAEEEAKEAARERWEDLEVDRDIEARLFGEG